MRIEGKNARNLTKKISSLVSSASWQGYNQSYVKNIIKGAMKALQLLSVLTFDPKLLFWTQGLKGHLEGRIREAEKELEEAERYIF